MTTLIITDIISSSLSTIAALPFPSSRFAVGWWLFLGSIVVVVIHDLDSSC